MGKFYRFLITLFVTCVFIIMPKDGWTYNPFRAPLELVSNVCWDDCDENNPTNELQKLCGGTKQEGQKAFKIVFDQTQYAKCDQCVANNNALKENFNKEECKEQCKQAGHRKNCDSWADYVGKTLKREDEDSKNTSICTTAKLKSAALETLGTVVLASGAVLTGGAGVLLYAGGTSLAATIGLAGMGLAGLTTMGVGIGVIANSKVTNGYPAILKNFISFDSPNQSTGCWFCPVFETVFKTVNELATATYTSLRDVFFSLLIICAIAWLLWTVFKFMITLHGPNIGEFMTNLFKGLGTVMLLAIILRAPPSFIAGYVVDVPVGIATGLAQEMMKMTGNDGSVTIAVPYEDSNGCRQVRYETTKFCNPTTNASDFDGKMLSVHVYDNMICLLRKMSFELIRGMAIGATIIEYSFKQATFGVLPNFTMLIGGIIMFVAYFILFIMVPFKLVDILLRMGFVVILLPLFIVCMATNATRGYAKKGWEMFLGCWITLVCLCLFMVFAITLIAAAFLK